MKVEIFSDINCPFCYLGLNRFNTGLAAFDHADDIEVIHRSFELDPTQPRGTSGNVVEHLAQQYGFSLEQAAQGELQLADVAHAEGLPYITQGRDFGDSFDMHRLVHFAQEQGRGEEMLIALFHANFGEEQSLFGDHERLVQVAVDEGFDEAQVREVLADETRYVQAVRDDEALAKELKCSAVPYFVLDRHFVVAGAEPAEVFTDALRQAWERHTAS
ncbi:MAG: DsbA family oxidoreductase [Gordonia sp. (in: high G+C Gram-positive bacteria)]|uniref:DsbA family oxidoreductase n=1 Tax=Gordonia sp. (in: high G+C Gram-positive bacteria) TaxID=84139 RepID=UPI0039E2901D